MEVIDKEELLLQKEHFMSEMEEGCVFIYPTDTVYGIGCDATNLIAVNKIRELKKIDDRPLSIIAPSKDWIKENFYYDDDWLDNLPGPYTLVMKLKNKELLKFGISNNDSIGVRIPNHWISSFVEKFKKPVITTSANITGKKTIEKIDELDESFKQEICFVVDQGELKGSASDIVYLDKDEVSVKKR